MSYHPVYYENFVGPLITESTAPLAAVVLGLPLTAVLLYGAYQAAVWIWNWATRADIEED